jgi:AraC-like DNA-binding protein
MAESSEATILSRNSSALNLHASDCDRINDVYQFILDNYTSNPTLEEVARVACMSTTAFCRYFKKHTNKTYVQFLNEVRIGNATKLLIDGRLTISQVCFETGFNNFNHFNNIFKRITNFTPGQYQHQYAEPSSKVV